MIFAILTLISAAFAGDPVWAGVPLDRLDDIGIGEPTLSQTEDAWRAPLPEGGWVRFWMLPDVAAAQQTFAFQSRAATSLLIPALATTYDEAIGDGTGYLVARKGNVVVLVRDPALGAAQIADRVLAELVTTATISPPSPGAEARDSVGRRVVSP